MNGTEMRDTKVLAFRLPIPDCQKLYDLAKPGETQSQLMRRVVHKFINPRGKPRPKS